MPPFVCSDNREKLMLSEFLCLEFSFESFLGLDTLSSVLGH